MIKQNLTNILIGLTVIGAILVAYNSFMLKQRAEELSASENVAIYLNLDITKPAVEEPSMLELNADGTPKVAVTDKNGNPATEQSSAPDQQPATENPAPSPTVVPEPTSLPLTAQTPDGDKPQTIYTVKDGDTYGCIAENYYGSYEHWVDVMNANPNQTGFTEYQLFVGAQIILPAISASNLKPASNLCS